MSAPNPSVRDIAIATMKIRSRWDAGTQLSRAAESHRPRPVRIADADHYVRLRRPQAVKANSKVAT